MFNFKKENPIQQKENELLVLKQNSNHAIDMVTTMINQLESVNEDIDTQEGQVDYDINCLTDIKIGLIETRLHNTKIIDKFRNLLSD